MKQFLRRHDLLWTVIVFAAMIPAERFGTFAIVEDALLGQGQRLRPALAEERLTAFRDDVVVLVSMDEAFYEAYGGFPLRRLDYGVLAAHLAELGASVVAIDAFLEQPSAYGDDPGTARAFAGAGNVLLATRVRPPAVPGGPGVLARPLPRFREVAGSGYTDPGPRSRTRTRGGRLRVLPELAGRPGGWPFPVQALAMHRGVAPRLEGGRLMLGRGLEVRLEGGTDLYLDPPRGLGDQRPGPAPHAVAPLDVLRLRELGAERRAALRRKVEGRIALVGDTSGHGGDVLSTPVGRMHGVEVVAAAIHTLANGVPVRPAPSWAELSSMVGTAGLVLGTGRVRRTPARILLTLLLLAVLVALALVLHARTGIVLSITGEFVAALVGAGLIHLHFRGTAEGADVSGPRAFAEDDRGLEPAFRDRDVAEPTLAPRGGTGKAPPVVERTLELPLGGAGPGGPDGTVAGPVGPAPSGAPGPVLGRYGIVRELGRGAMTSVYLGEDPTIGRRLAIKTLSLTAAPGEGGLARAKDRFFQEARSAGCLDHPGIVTIHDAGEADDFAYIAMEFVPGHDLSRHTRPDTLLPLDTVLSIGIQCAEALHYAHARGVLHRDVKPSNIMYDPASGRAKLTDFGIACVSAGGGPGGRTIVGTPNYMSPEQALGRELDGRSDLFSLGVVLFQLCTGQAPFPGESMGTVLHGIVHEPHPDVTRLRPELPRALRKIIDNALGKAPEGRYQQGGRMAEHLRTCLSRLRASGRLRES